MSVAPFEGVLFGLDTLVDMVSAAGLHIDMFMSKATPGDPARAVGD